ncbi:MAG: C_GCAxxG_C_C family protein [Chloroflexi bacterium]|nr:C_GCAxxG_C_C family protein [Chloroflexota bacterium]
MDSLREKIGFPYTQMPTDFMTYGVGGLADTASLCGAINGAAAAMTLVLGKDDWKKIVKELVNWYTKTPFPSDISNQYAKDHKFLVEKYKSDKVFVSSVSRSTLCHVSVTKWCKASGYASGSDERSERCGRLTADVAAQAVVLLNQFADKNFKAVTASPASAECVPCHSLGKDYKLGQYTRGEEDCVLCHTPHEIKK